METESLTFAFRPITVGNKPAFHIDVRFRAATTQTKLLLPASWDSASHLEREIQDLKVLTPGVAMLDGSGPGEKMLQTVPKERVEIAYDLISLQTEWFQHPQEQMAIINSDYFLFNPQNALVCPDFSPLTVIDAVFDWRALPKGMPLFSSFGDSNRVLRVRAPWYQIREALFAGGDFRVTESNLGGVKLVLAARGIWKFTDAEAFSQISRILDAESSFWHAQKPPYFLVTLAPFDNKSSLDDGSAFTNAFMLFLSHEDTFDAARIRLLAHEMFHHWNPISMGPVDAHSDIDWFTEGFTAYYESVIPLRAHLISYSEYLDDLNHRFWAYQMNAPLQTGTYARGPALALWADSAIRNRSDRKSSLDDVLFDLVHQGSTHNPPELTNDRLFAAFAQYLSPEEMIRLRRFVEQGAKLALPERLGNCADLQPVTRNIYDLGLSQKSLMAQQISGVDPAGPAYRAGIRDGQEIKQVTVNPSSSEISFGVIVNGEEKMIRYSYTKPLALKQYRPTAAANDEVCNPF